MLSLQEPSTGGRVPESRRFYYEVKENQMGSDKGAGCFIAIGFVTIAIIQGISVGIGAQRLSAINGQSHGITPPPCP